MTGASGAAGTTQRLEQIKRLLYALILGLVAFDLLLAHTLSADPQLTVWRYGLAAAALFAATALVLVPRLIRLLEVGVLLIGAVLLVGFLVFAISKPVAEHVDAVRTFSVWAPLLVVWAFLAFNSRLALAISAAFLLSGAAPVLIHLASVGEPVYGRAEYAALAELMLVGAAYLALLFALTHSVERRSALLAAQETVERMLAIDALTGLANRDAFQRYHQELARRGVSEPFNLLIVDIDDFRSINERYSTEVGDNVLREAALRLIRGPGRDAEMVARIGADEFGILLKGALDDKSSARLAAAAGRVFHAPFRAGGGAIQVTATMGMSRFPYNARTQADQVSQAEAAVVSAKRAGATFHLASENTLETERLALARDLKEALGRSELELYFQPIAMVTPAHSSGGAVELTVTAFETLLRWNHPIRGRLAPEEFIPLAETMGLIGTFGSWVLNEACEQAMAWQREGLGSLTVTVNISLHQLLQGGLAERIKNSLAASGLAPERLILELTETSADQSDIAELIAEIRRTGVRVALDDFGSGYSSLGRLNAVPVDLVKLDRSWMETGDGRNRLIIRGAVVLAHDLGAKVVAEGIERPEQAEAALNAGCDYLQGYLIDPPLDKEEFARSWKAGKVVAWHGPNLAPAQSDGQGEWS